MLRRLVRVTIAGLVLCMAILDAIAIPAPFETADIAATTVFLVLGFAYLVRSILRTGVRMHLLVVLYAMYLLVSLPGLLYSPNISLAVRAFGREISYWLLVFIVSAEKDSKWYRDLLQLTVVAAIVPIAVAIQQVVDLYQVGGLTLAMSARPRGTMSHANFLAEFLLISLGACWVLHVEPMLRKWRLSWMYCGLLFGGVCVFLLTLARNVWIGAAVATTVYAVVAHRMAPFVALLGVAFLGLGLPGVRARLVSIVSPDDLMEAGSSFTWRLDHWSSVIQIWLEHALTGSGPKVVEFLTGYAPHNIYLGALAERGILGAGTLLVLFSYMVVLSYRHATSAKLSPWNRTVNRLWLAVLAAWLVMGLADNALSVPSATWYFWLLAGIGAGTSSLSTAHLRDRSETRAERAKRNAAEPFPT